MKFDRIVPKVNMYQLTASRLLYDVTLSRRWPLAEAARAVATGGISVYVYPPKIRPGKFLWSKNDVLLYTLLYLPQKVQQ